VAQQYYPVRVYLKNYDVLGFASMSGIFSKSDVQLGDQELATARNE
jgi:hypothetical protein